MDGGPSIGTLRNGIGCNDHVEPLGLPRLLEPLVDPGWHVVGVLRVLVENLIGLPALILQRGTVLSR